jgi:hypothetical protein
LEILSDISSNYDIIAIQEILDDSETTMQPFKDKLTEISGNEYDFIISSPPDESSKERYAFLFKTETVKALGIGSTYPEPQGEDPFMLEPFLAPFEAKKGNFDFVLITLRADSDRAEEEINGLPDVVEYAKTKFQSEDDFIILGDLSSDCTYFDENGASSLKTSEFIWLTDNSEDTSVKTIDCTFDRIIITPGASEDFTGESGVFKFDSEYGMSYSDSQEVTDHYPVFAEFWTHKDTS